MLSTHQPGACDGMKEDNDRSVRRKVGVISIVDTESPSVRQSQNLPGEIVGLPGTLVEVQCSVYLVLVDLLSVC